MWTTKQVQEYKVFCEDIYDSVRPWSLIVAQVVSEQSKMVAQYIYAIGAWDDLASHGWDDVVRGITDWVVRQWDGKPETLCLRILKTLYTSEDFARCLEYSFKVFADPKKAEGICVGQE